MKVNKLEFSDVMALVFPEITRVDGVQNSGELRNFKTITFQVTESCNLRCTYCYQINKHQVNMTEETAKKFIDDLFKNRFNKDYYINEYNTCGLIIEFIGGEPFCNTELIEYITEYFETWFTLNPDCPWTLNHVYNYSSNGTLHKDEKVQKYLDKYNGLVVGGITVDGCKSCHDECRLFENGSGSYDLAIESALDLKNKAGVDSTKITLSPYNVKYIYESVVNMIELGFYNININCAFEEGWTIENAKTIYSEFKKVADYIKEHNLYDDIYVRMLDATEYTKVSTDIIDKNFCGGTNCMLALQPSGKIYTCIRFMDTSLGNKVKDLPIGHVDHGIGYTEEEKYNLKFLDRQTTRTQSNEECLNCPIGNGCSYCTAYNYQYYGEFKRATFICDCHKSAALASLYLSKIMGDRKNYDLINIPEEWALTIIPKEEWESISNFERD